MKEPFASNGSRRRLVQQLRYSQSDWTSFWGLHTRYILDLETTSRAAV
jgi:hypothetical protein